MKQTSYSAQDVKPGRMFKMSDGTVIGCGAVHFLQERIQNVQIGNQYKKFNAFGQSLEGGADIEAIITELSLNSDPIIYQINSDDDLYEQFESTQDIVDEIDNTAFLTGETPKEIQQAFSQYSDIVVLTLPELLKILNDTDPVSYYGVSAHVECK